MAKWKKITSFVILLCLMVSIISMPSMIKAADVKKADEFIAKDFINSLKDKSNSSTSKKETEFKDPNEAIDVYINYIEGILTDQLSAGLLTYE